MRLNGVMLMLLAPLLLASSSTAQPAGSPAEETSDWTQYADPEEAGWRTESLAAAREHAEAIDSAAVLCIVRGHALFAWGDVERRFKCYSVRKSLLSALIGIHHAQNHIDLEATLAELEIDDRQGLTEVERSARVIDLLRGRSGVYHPAAKEPADMSAGRPERGSHEPDTFFFYNNWDFNTLLTIFEQTTGTRIFEEFERSLAKPLAMQDYRVSDGFYQLEPSKSWHAAYAFRMSTRDLARVGWLYANQGRWGDDQVIPAAWIEESTRPYSPARSGGYGFMWWSYPAGSFGEGTRLDTLDRYDKYAAQGTGGQLVLVVPAAELVLVHRGDTDNDRPVRGTAIWDLAELILEGRIESPSDAPRLVTLSPVAFASAGPAPVEREVVAVPTEELKGLVGDYALPMGGVATVSLWKGRLFLRAPAGELELFALGNDRFFARAERLGARFARGPQGEATECTVTWRGRTMSAKRSGE